MNKGYVKYGLCDKIQSKMIKAQCEEYGLPYYETSHGWEKVMMFSALAIAVMIQENGNLVL